MEKDSWWLLTEVAKINNQNQGVDKMLEVLEANKSLMDHTHAEVLMDYIELLPENNQYFDRVNVLVSPFAENVHWRGSFRLSIMQSMMQEEQS